MSADLVSPIPASDGHFTVDTLADFDAGVYDDTVTIELKQHLASCVHCGQVLIGLGDVRLRLRTLPDIRMPDRVADQVFHALRLAQENGTPANPAPIRVASATPAGKPQGSSPVADISLARERRARRLRWTSWVAAGVVLLGGAIGTATVIATHNSGSGSVQAEPQPPASSAPAVPEFNDKSIQNALGVIALRGKISGDTGPGEAVAGRMARADQRSQCQEALAKLGFTATPQAVQAITYEGVRGYVFVYPAGRAVVVKEDCNSTGADILFRQ